MIRRGIIVLLTLATLGTVYLRHIAQTPITRTEMPAVDEFASTVTRRAELDTVWDWSIHEDRTVNLRTDGGLRLWAIPASGRLLGAIAVPRDPQENQPDVEHKLGSMCGLATDLILPLDSAHPHVRAYVLALPTWIPIVACGLLPAVALVRGPVRRAQWRRIGLCAKCGYDLTGIAAEKCPECARVFNVEGRAHAFARFQSRVRKAIRWVETYRLRRRRKLFARFLLGVCILVVPLWAFGYWRPAILTPWFNCRVVWGCIAIFGDARISEYDGRNLAVVLGGYQSLETWWWPFALCDWRRRWVFVPFWLIFSICLTGWFVLHRPDRQRLARRYAFLLEPLVPIPVHTTAAEHSRVIPTGTI